MLVFTAIVGIGELLAGTTTVGLRVGLCVKDTVTWFVGLSVGTLTVSVGLAVPFVDSLVIVMVGCSVVGFLVGGFFVGAGVGFVVRLVGFVVIVLVGFSVNVFVGMFVDVLGVCVGLLV